MSEKKLTPKQARFVKEYIRTGNGTQSAIKAGYSKYTANEIAAENLAKPSIKVKIDKVMNNIAEEMGINAEFVLGNLKHFAIKKKLKSASAAIKANELLGKHLKLWNDEKLDLTVQHRAAIAQLEDLE